MKKLAISAFYTLAAIVAVVALGADKAEAGGCPMYNAYYNNGYYQSYCYPSYAPTPIIYTPPVIPVQTLYNYHPTYAIPTAPVYFQGPRQYYPYYQTPLYTYPRYAGYGGYGW